MESANSNNFLLNDDTLFKDETASKPFTRRRILIDDKQFII